MQTTYKLVGSIIICSEMELLERIPEAQRLKEEGKIIRKLQVDPLIIKERFER